MRPTMNVVRTIPDRADGLLMAMITIDEIRKSPIRKTKAEMIWICCVFIGWTACVRARLFQNPETIQPANQRAAILEKV